MEQKTTIKPESTAVVETAKTKKPMPPSRKKEHTRKNITVRFSDSEREKIEQAAERSGLFLTQLIRVRALKEDEVIAKRLETLGDLRRSVSLIKAVYKAINKSNLDAFERKRALKDLDNIKLELKCLAEILEKNKA